MSDRDDGSSQRPDWDAGEVSWTEERAPLATRSNAGRDRTTRNHGEVQCERKFLVERPEFDPANKCRQSECDFEHGEMVSDARAGSAAEWHVLPSIESLEV